MLCGMRGIEQHVLKIARIPRLQGCVFSEEIRLERQAATVVVGVRYHHSAMPVKLVVEYAKSGRSSCRQCSSLILKGDVRVGSVSKGSAGHLMTQWYHVNCVAKARVGDGATVEGIGGFRLLKALDQKVLRETFVPVVDVGSEASVVEERLCYDKEKWEDTLSRIDPSKLSQNYKGATLPEGWKAVETVIVGQADGVPASPKIAAFDFDGCLVDTSIFKHGADHWSLLYPSIPEKLQGFHNDGFKLVIFTNESNIDRWVKSRQQAIDSKVGRLEAFRKLVAAPILIFIACATSGSSDPCRKPAPGMWQLMERHFNEGIPIDRGGSFYVGDAAGRPGDHSDADITFAKASGVRFLLPEEMFLAPTAESASTTSQISVVVESAVQSVHQTVDVYQAGEPEGRR